MFLQVDYRYLRSRTYLEFMSEPAHLTWMFLRARIYRPPKGRPGHPHYIGFYNYGWLAAHCSLSQLVDDWQGLRSRSAIHRDVGWLEEQHLVEVYPDPEGTYATVFRLGSWSDYEHTSRDLRRGPRQRIEVLYADRIFLLDGAEPWAELDEVVELSTVP